NADLEVLSFAQRPDIQKPRRPAGSTAVHTNTDVAIGHPLLRINDFPVLILVGRPCRNIRVHLTHPAPLLGVEVLKVEAFAVWPVSDDLRVLAVLNWPIDVATQHDTIVHLDRDLPVDLQAVANNGGSRIFHKTSSS